MIIEEKVVQISRCMKCGTAEEIILRDKDLPLNTPAEIERTVEIYSVHPYDFMWCMECDLLTLHITESFNGIKEKRVKL